MTHPVLFLTDRSKWHQAQALKDAPADLTVTILDRSAPKGDLLHWLPYSEFIISERAEPVTADMIKLAIRLRGIVRLGSLPVGIDLAAACAANVTVSLQPVLGAIYVAEHVLMMTLAVLKRLGRGLWLANQADHGKTAQRTDENTFAFNWLGLTDVDGLYGKTIAILGMGEIGVELARRVQAFRPETVLYYKRERYPVAIEQSLGITHADQETCLARANVLVSLLPYAKETDRSLNASALAKLPKGAYLIHAGSGSVIDESALIDSLRTGQLAGAALDTYEYEPLQPDNPLIAMARDPRSNLLLTPHTAGASLPGSRGEDYAEIMRSVRGESLRYAIDLNQPDSVR